MNGTKGWGKVATMVNMGDQSESDEAVGETTGTWNDERHESPQTPAALVPHDGPVSGQPIMLRDKGDYSVMVAEAGSGFRQPMRGFDPDYVDIVDYIVRITHRIWEERGVGLIYDTYGHNISLWTTEGLAIGREMMVANTLRTLAAYPGRKIYVEDVVWSGNEDDGFHTSMRAVSVGYNTGYSQYGPPTGRRVVRRGIANCLVKENRIIEEWITHDELHVVRQLGFDPFEAAERAARADAARGKIARNGDHERVLGQQTPKPYPAKTGTGFDVEDFLRRAMHEIWNQRLLNKIDDYYVADFRGHASSGKELYGLGDLKVHSLALLAAFPDAVMTFEYLYWLTDTARGEYRTAMRWALTGTHDGPGFYGPPTGKQVYLMGITQHVIRNEKIVEEWSVFDEFALLKQLAVV